MRSYPVCVIHPVAGRLKFGLLPALAIGMTVCLVLEFGICLLDRSNGPVLMIPFCRSTRRKGPRARAGGYKLTAVVIGEPEP
jgi:hypothetical protein